MALSPTEEAQTRDLIAQQAALLSLAGVEPTILSKLGATKVTLSALPTASAINDSDLLLLRQGTTDKSVTGLTFKGLIPTVADASTTVKGKVLLAQSSGFTGTGSATDVPPVAAIIAGLLGAGTAANYFSIPYKDAGTGEIKKIIIQHGNSGAIPSASQVTITLPITAPSSILRVLATAESSTSDSTPISCAWSYLSASQFVLRNKSSASAIFTWVAITY